MVLYLVQSMIDITNWRLHKHIYIHTDTHKICTYSTEFFSALNSNLQVLQRLFMILSIPPRKVKSSHCSSNRNNNNKKHSKKVNIEIQKQKKKSWFNSITWHSSFKTIRYNFDGSRAWSQRPHDLGHGRKKTLYVRAANF